MSVCTSRGGSDARIVARFATVVEPPTIRGVGARDPRQPAALEENEHATFEVYAAPIQESDDYFHAIRRELQEALQEGVILIERQQVTLI